MIRKNMKLIIGIILGIISVGGVYAASSLNAREITIDNSNMPKITGEKLNNALDYLYTKANQTNTITIESGVKHLSQTYLGIAYLDPTNLNKKCSEADAKANRNQDGTITGVKTGCMKWYIYKEDSNNYYAILDHNTTATVQWNSDNDNTVQKEVADALETDTTGWGTMGEDIVDLKPRLISANEIAEITEANTLINWNSSTSTNSFYFDSKSTTAASGQGTSNYAWVYDNTGWTSNGTEYTCTNYGCNTTDTLNSAGYWTDTAYLGNGSGVWTVNRDGRMVYYHAYDVGIGLRPVITIPKS